MNIAVFGLGYVGVVTAACLAREGHTIFGIDRDTYKVDLLNNGRSPIVEEQIDELVASAVRDQRLLACTESKGVVARTDMAIVCVGTPSLPGGGLDATQVEGVAREIAAALAAREQDYTVVIRSTVVPGTVRDRVIPELERASGKNAGVDFNVVFHPEFLREGTSVKDFYDPPKIVAGEYTAGAADALMQLYHNIDAPRVVTSLEAAEMVKYCDNLFHAVKITFANEVGQLCHSVGVDSQEVMEIFCQDTKLNISPKYLRPGFAFGGSCLPKDLRASLSFARQRDLRLPMLENILTSNATQIDRALQHVLSLNVRRIGFYGLAFKPGTDDLRESPLVELAERLIGKGAQLKCYDEHVRVARLIGGNRAYVQRTLPHLAALLVQEEGQLDDCELIVVGHPVEPRVVQRWLERGIFVYDLVAARLPIAHEKYSRVV